VLSWIKNNFVPAAASEFCAAFKERRNLKC